MKVFRYCLPALLIISLVLSFVAPLSISRHGISFAPQKAYADDFSIDVGSGAAERASNTSSTNVTFIDLANSANASGILRTVKIFANSIISGAVIGSFYESSNPLDIGPGATDRASTTATDNVTYIDLANTANATGLINEVQIWANSNMTGVRIGSFYLSGSNYICRDSTVIGNVTSGSVQTFSDLNINVTLGDYLGIYVLTGGLEKDTTGGSGIVGSAGEHIDPTDEVHSSGYIANLALSLYATGIQRTAYFCRDSKNIGAVMPHSLQVYDNVGLNIVVGDYLGIYLLSGGLEKDTTGGVALVQSTGNHTGIGDIAYYTSTASAQISIYAEGVQEITSEVFKISVDSSNHTTYGLGYPMTFTFNIPGGSSGLKAYKKYSSGSSWTQLTEKTSSDFFNGVEVVRFDYSSNQALISAAFSGSTDDIYLKITDSGDVNVSANYTGLATYYDQRKAAVTVSLDGSNLESLYDTAWMDIFQSNNVTVSLGVVTDSINSTTWGDFQSQIDEGCVELVSHSRTHPNIPYDDYVSEIAGSKGNITGNVTMPSIWSSGANEYVYAWLQPYGEEDASVRTQLGLAHYLFDRYYDIDQVTHPYVYGFSTWDSTNGLYNPINPSMSMGELWATTTDADILNTCFTNAYNAGGIYHLAGHPHDIDWSPGSYAQNHIAFISDKTDVWYVGIGSLYLYHYVQDRNILVVTQAADGVLTPTVTSNSSSSIEETTATCTGEVTSADNVTGRSIEYGIATGVYTATENETGNFAPGTFSLNLTGLTKGELYFWRAGATTAGGTGYGSELTFLTKPDLPTGINLTPGAGEIAIEWNAEASADSYMVRCKQGEYPSGYSDGVQVYSGSNITTTHTGLDDSATWYYRVWSYCAEGGLIQWSDSYTEGTATTDAAPATPTPAPTTISWTWLYSVAFFIVLFFVGGMIIRDFHNLRLDSTDKMANISYIVIDFVILIAVLGVWVVANAAF